MSGGERRRLLLARALLVGSSVLLLDEPVEHLDDASADALMAELASTARTTGVAVVVVTHHRASLHHAHRVVEVARGRVLTEVAGPDQLRRNASR